MFENGGDLAIGQKHASLLKGRRDAQAASTLSEKRGSLTSNNAMGVVAMHVIIAMAFGEH